MYQRIACCRVAVALTVALTVACSSSTHRPVGSPLPGGFRVPSGATLVGVPAPLILPERATRTTARGVRTPGRTSRWSALLRITGGPAAIYHDFVRQLTARGWALSPGSDRACVAAATPTAGRDVRCTGNWTNTGKRSFSVTVVGCQSCRPKSGFAELGARGAGVQRIQLKQLATLIPSRTGPPPPSTWPELPGTRVLAQADLSQFQGSLYTVLEVTGSPDGVWERYLARYGSSTRFEPITRAYEATFAGTRVRQVFGGETGQSELVTLVQGDGLSLPVLTVSLCSD